MKTRHAQRRPQEGIQETRLVRREEAAYERNAHPNNSQPLGGNFQSPEYEQVRSYRSAGQRENATVALFDRGENSGKISERLKLIEESFLSYVRSNQERLEAQLDQSRMLEQNFLAAIRELESEISSLVPEQEDQSNEDLSLESIQGISHKQ